jgi:hypothetical protein
MGSGYGPSWVKLPGQKRVEPGSTSLLLQVESRGWDDTDADRRQRIVIGGQQALSVSAPRSYQLTRLVNDGSGWQVHSSIGLDVYGSQAAADDLLDYLQTFSTGDVLVLNTNDEPNFRRGTFSGELTQSFGSKLQSSETWEHRCSYILIARKGKGAIYESVGPRFNTVSNCVTLYMRGAL